jgi:hypothetical protein
MDGKMARARRWKCEKFQHSSVSTKIGEERVRGRVPFIPLEAKGRHLDQLPSVKERERETNLKKGAPKLGFGREKNEMVRWRGLIG